MGTTMVALLVAHGSVYVGHVGDSRAYLLRDGSLSQLTEDHSLLNDYLKMHNLSPEEIENFPHKNVIVRALGMKERVDVDVQQHTARAGDIYMLCSDGLSGMLSDEAIDSVLHDALPDLEGACAALVHSANARGGTDNITTVLVQIGD